VKVSKWRVKVSKKKENYAKGKRIMQKKRKVRTPFFSKGGRRNLKKIKKRHNLDCEENKKILSLG